MSVASGVRLRAIRPQADKTFFKDGKFIVTTGTGDDAEQSTESEETTLSDVEKNPEKKVSVMKMVGKASPYEIELTKHLSCSLLQDMNIRHHRLP